MTGLPHDSTARPPEPRGRRDFEIAIICALGLESDAVEILFDHHHRDFGKAPGDPNSYRTGRVANHNVVLVYMPQMGKGPAAAVSAHLLSSFERIKLALIVGVCGGVPEGSHGDIFLGDVVISDKIANYDYGRRLPDGFMSKESAWTPNFQVTSFLRRLRGWKGRQDLKKRTNHHHGVLRAMDSTYHHPTSHGDRLFERSYRHKHHALQSCMACNADQACKAAQDATCDELQCNLKHCIMRSRPDLRITGTTQDPTTAIHFGCVASGDTIMKSGEDRDAIARQHAAIGFEMEGAGVCSSLQCIVVKGVCDYADSHKDKLWQPFAAGIAAACMKAILEEWIPNSGCPTQEALPSEAFQAPSCPPPINIDTDLLSGNRHVPTSCGGFSGREPPEQGKSRDVSEAEDDSWLSDACALLQELHGTDGCFKQTSLVFRQCRKSLPRDTDVRRILKTQRAKFRTTIETLLSQATGSPDDAQSMVVDSQHKGWQSKDIRNSIYSHLGSGCELGLKIIMDIQQKLSIAEGSAKRLYKGKEINKQDTGAMNNSDILKASLEDLGSLIRVFSSAVPSHEQPNLRNEPTKPTSKILARTVEHFGIVQQAANSLYNALGKSCSEHTLHNVHLSLQPRLNGAFTQVEFSVGFSGPDMGSSRARSESIWINVESVIKSTASNTEVSSRSYLVSETAAVKHTNTEARNSRPNKRKRVTFKPISEPISSSLLGMAELNVPNLFLQQNLCTVVQRQLYKQISIYNNCIGILGDGTMCRHLVYMKQHAEKEAASSSLSELILLSKRHSAKSLGQYDRVRLARYLATAVLYYHTTPWLNGTWKSEDVYFFGNADGGSLFRSSDALPYISACVQATSPVAKRPPLSVYDLIIRNPVVFSLGVILLELAYQTPFDDLKHEVDITRGTLPLANYFAAKRLAEDVNVHISASFKRIVKQCIDCDFGHDTDFQSPALQNVFNSQVIGGLEELEKKLQRLQLDD
ncbi:hypothetical protein BJX68DRAFT_94769 [Aspergillus pseudodeflectus]|uniref:Nucleoside phosphorylase domain-containing protein n=1 Tax=Aspergillus pseudodeflectus TaxID=176178 RepID=A0ABR4KBQ1_9EURO